MAIALAKNSSSKFSLSKKLSKTTRRSQRQRRRSNPFGLVYERDDRLGMEEVETDTEYGVSLAMGKTEFTVTSQGIGIGLNIAGIGGKVSTEKGGTVGIGFGIVGVEYNMEGGGEIDYLFGLYRIIVERVGCTYVKEYYIQGIYTHTEVEEIDGCIPEDPERKAIRQQMSQRRNNPADESRLLYTVPDGLYCNGAWVTRISDYYHYPTGSEATCSYYDERQGETYKKKTPILYQTLVREVFEHWTKLHSGQSLYYVSHYWDKYQTSNARFRTRPKLPPDEYGGGSKYDLTEIWWPGGLSDSKRCQFSGLSSLTWHSYRFRRYLETTIAWGGWTDTGLDENGNKIRWAHSCPVEIRIRFNFLHPDGTGYFSGSGTGRYSRGNLGKPGCFKDPRKKKMECCFTKEDRKMLKKVYGVTGCKAFPVIHPKTLQGNSSETVELQSLVEQLVWVTQYLDMTLGQWPVTLKIPDIDPTKPGNQESAPIQVPNVSELLAEMYGLSLQEAITRSDKRVEFKSAMEIELVKKALFRLKFDVEAMIDYLGFDDEFEKRKLKLAFNPRDAQNFVENSEEQVRVRVFKPGKKNPTLNSILDKLLVAASHVQKAFGIPLNPLNMAGSLMDFFRGVAGTSESDKIEKLKDLLESGALTDDDIGSTDNPKLRTPNTEESGPS